MVFNATFNNMSAMEETGEPRENFHRSQVTDKLYHIKLYQVPLAMSGIQTLVVIDTDYIGSCKSSYHTITTMTTPTTFLLFSKCFNGTALQILNTS